MKNALVYGLVLIVCLLSPSFVAATSITPDARGDVLGALRHVLETDYFDAARGARMAAEIEANQQAGVYDALEDSAALASRLTSDLYALSNDLHFHVLVDSDWVAAERKKDDPKVAEVRREEALASATRANFGFREVRILEGNVGYLNLSVFEDPEIAHDAAAAAMRLLSGADAVLIDLRFNNGGYLEMAQLLLSYFLSSAKSTPLFHYSDLQDGERVEGTQRVLPSVSGIRRPDVPLYVLTSNASFSAAEWFAYVLKNLGRATIVGEQTAGGAHPVNRRALDDQFIVQVPTGQIQDGVLGTDFEGVGVTPDVETNAALAISTAHRLALRARIDAEDPDLVWLLPVVESRLQPASLDESLRDGIVGHYGHRRISREGDTLYYAWSPRGRTRLLPLGANLLALEGVDDFRFRVRTEAGKVTGLERVFADGTTVIHEKTEK